jgi:hypothetical protein
MDRVQVAAKEDGAFRVLLAAEDESGEGSVEERRLEAEGPGELLEPLFASGLDRVFGMAPVAVAHDAST